jgi:hypothetical protein
MKKMKHQAAADGTFYMSFDDFRKNFTQVDRCIIFNSKWTMAKCYTYYSNGKKLSFSIKTGKRMSMVNIAFSQKNQRYAHGIDLYKLPIGFKLFKSTTEDPLNANGYVPVHTEQAIIDRCVGASIEMDEKCTYVLIPTCGYTEKKQVKLCLRVYSKEEITLEDLIDREQQQQQQHQQLVHSFSPSIDTPQIQVDKSDGGVEKIRPKIRPMRASTADSTNSSNDKPRPGRGKTPKDDASETKEVKDNKVNDNKVNVQVEENSDEDNNEVISLRPLRVSRVHKKKK